jgi:hypothetical protein
MRHHKLAAALAGLALSLGAADVLASGPLDLNPNDPDNFTRWANGGLNIPYNPDQGGLATLNNAQAVQFVTDAYQQWENVPTSTATYSNQGLMPFDVDVTNYAPYIQNLFFGTNNSDGLSPIVFDEDGAIFLDLFGPSGILGFASADTFDADGVPIEGVAFLNGGQVLGGFPLFPDFFAVFVHEFGHYSGMAHTIVNGQAIALGDTSGPTPFDDFGPPPPDQVETMYPFAIVGGGQQTLHADDISFYSRLYPAPGFLDNTVTITGQILSPNGATPLTGVNVIARNTDNPFVDAVSAISGDRGVTGEFTINGLTPGANYRLFVDSMGPTEGAGAGFSTPGIALPGPEEYYNGALESGDGATDDPADFVLLSAAGGDTLDGTDVIFNGPAPGVPLQLGDDASVELFMPFTFEICGQRFDSLFVNSNGNLTFGSGDPDFSESVAEFLRDQPRIAPLWDDLNPSAAGTVVFYQTADTFTVSYEDVPEFPATGANTFEVILDRASNHVDVVYGELSATDGLAGVSCGGAVTSGFEAGDDLSAFAPRRINLKNQPARYEQFNGSNPNDLASSTVRFNGTTDYNDNWAEPNDSIAKARRIKLPFDSIPITRYTEIEPVGGDVDYFSFDARGGTTLLIDLPTGGFDSVLGLYDAGGNLVAVDDDGGTGVLSRIVYPVATNGRYYVAVSSFPDLDFSGDGGSGGRYVLDISSIEGILLSLGDDDSEELPLGFSFPFNGADYTSVFVNSNGNLTFGSGDPDFSESVPEFLGEQPRIAPLWDDLNPSAAGLIIADGDGSSMTVTFSGVPEFPATGSNTFSVTMLGTGDVVITYGGVTATDGLAGVTEGGGAADPGPTDLSAGGPYDKSGTTYEQFNFGNPFDLGDSVLNFDQ